MVKQHLPDPPGTAAPGAPATGARRVLGISLSAQDYAAFAALAAADSRAPGALGKILILEFLARRRTAAMPQQGTIPERSS